MPKFHFKSDELKRAITLVKTIKSSTGDISFGFNSKLVLFNYDNRRQIVVNSQPSEEVDCGEFTSDEFYVFADKTDVFDSGLSDIVISVNSESLSVVASEGTQTKKFNLKKRSTKNKRPTVPMIPDIEFTSVSKKEFEEVIRSVSCSAGIKDTKTEDDMRVMQVHFYNNGFASSSTRYHGSLVHLESMIINTSIISSDLPFIKSFCSKISSSQIKFGDDGLKLYVVDPESDSFISFSKISTSKPDFSIIPDKFNTAIKINRETFLKSLKWASLAIERTQRINLSTYQEDDKNFLKISFLKQEATGIPIELLYGDVFSVDLSVSTLLHIIGFIDDDIIIKFNHQEKKFSSFVEITSFNNSANVKSSHYMTVMRGNGN